MKKIIGLAAAGLIAAAIGCETSAKDAPDAVVMTVGGDPVNLSEFKYLYNKNNSQQQNNTKLSDYVDMFVNYKLKVKAAKDAGLDTVATYRAEMANFTKELAAPYLQDQATVDSLVEVAYSHLKENVAVSHIMLPVNEQYSLARQTEVLDSLTREIKQGVDFAAAARRHSVDQSVASNGGYQGYIPAGYLPYEFEDWAYRTPVDSISPVFATRFGAHIIKVHDRRPDPGEVKVRHILKLTQGLDEAGQAAAKAKIDSIRALIVAGADFSTVAKMETDDPSGKASGGDLPWFGVGRMVPEFEKASFALADGELSEPVLTSYGYHLILREGHRGAPDLADVSEAIKNQMMNDSRRQLIEGRTADKYAAKTDSKINAKGLASISKAFKKYGNLNEAAVAALKKDKTELYRVDGVKTTVGQYVANLAASTAIDSMSQSAVAAGITAEYRAKVAQEMLATLPQREPEYQSLLNEYSDGLLLYEVSNREVWNKPNTDAEGLEAFFKANRSDFAWTEPHFKGYVLSAETDSIADAAMALLNELQPEESQINVELRKKFSNKVKVDKVIVGRGDNAIVDYVAFSGPVPPTDKVRWKAYRPYSYKIIDQPESATDVRGTASMRYQQQLEEQWIKRLREQYKVDINYDLLNQMEEI